MRWIDIQFGPSPVQYLPNLTEALGGKVRIWAKREDCNSGLAYGGNKVRKVCAFPYSTEQERGAQ
jgi:1-aminocyclopropane-1-carboxylate deaminase/D-cysteine desulfhydrase-like pyridoxal-dependent ACC family enzyme